MKYPCVDKHQAEWTKSTTWILTPVGR